MSKRIFTLLGAYLIILAASHLVRCQGPKQGVARPGAATATVREWQRDTPTGNHVLLSYRDLDPLGDSRLPTLLLLHGSPVASVSLEPFANALGHRYRLILPDLPGFGGSTLRIADYSARSYAHNTLELMDLLEVESAHVFAYSMGGAVALHMASLAPKRVDSLILTSSIGVQELELLGDYTLNHAVHGLQLACLSVFQEGVPHFGWMDRFPLNRYYARNFFDLDQRPLRFILTTLEAPTLIVHGKDDVLVPYAAALEHHRIVPQSNLAALPNGDHITVIRDPHQIAPIVANFVDTVEAGSGVFRGSASPSRIALAAEPFDHHRSRQDSWPVVVFLMVLLSLATFVTEDLTCIMAGLMVSRGAMAFLPATIGCLVGIFVGDMLLYAAGRFLGPPALQRVPFKWFLSADQVAASQTFFRRRGPALIFATRFLPGTRLATYFAAGMFKAPFLSFAGWFLLAALVWTPSLVGLATWLGGPMLDWFEDFERFALLGLAGVVAALWLILKLGIPVLTHRGRRLLVASWRRRRRWEFWPMWLFYPPVAVYVLWLGIKHRSLTLFTAANPAIPHGGVVLESKSEILDQFQEAPEIARYHVLQPGPAMAMLDRLEAFMARETLAYPIVLKPDVGERGAGVTITTDRETALTYLRASQHLVIAQEFVPGREFGIFYARRPSEARGHIISITDKRLIYVEGDGTRTLERLILDHERAVCMAKFFFGQFGARIGEVPRAGERVALTHVGTHCRGALFLDGARFMSAALESSIDRLSRQVEGFFFGRYDLRVPSEDDLVAGRNLKILELNGVTSESTHIYDPRHSLTHAYGALFRQWKIAFEIGAENAKLGVRPTTFPELVRLVLRMKHHPASLHETD